MLYDVSGRLDQRSETKDHSSSEGAMRKPSMQQSERRTERRQRFSEQHSPPRMTSASKVEYFSTSFVSEETCDSQKSAERLSRHMTDSRRSTLPGHSFLLAEEWPNLAPTSPTTLETARLKTMTTTSEACILGVPDDVILEDAEGKSRFSIRDWAGGRTLLEQC
ncbi:hypothetical protein PMAYCL1PPCAC_32825 [Pristionchus mayeri]|uniref:Uncharacterized protein n=1 Tax=Pristionchus mayeri TaxID=1317129 RepID=A0AAN5DGZ6_9BILA|nr:hypothetical protein PMAYCL1PPCAC_32825 [Pristionchus mayeri]